MDDFTSDGNTFEESLVNLEKVLVRCQESNLVVSNEKCNMILDASLVLGNHIYSMGIRVDPTKIEVIINLEILASQREVRSFLGHPRYCWHFLKILLKLPHLYLNYL